MLRSRGARGGRGLGRGLGRLLLLVAPAACYDGGIAVDTDGTASGSGDTTAPSASGVDDGATDAGECPPGGRGCPCMLGGVCDDGLACQGGTCESLDPVCGDGRVEGAEQCDSGEALDDEGACKTDCTLAGCGDGFLGPGEACDDGNLVPHDACTNACQPPACGDGVLHDGEQCDDGLESDADACTGACLLAYCGDGIVWRGHEQCDDANDDDADGCTSACETVACGDGITNGGEQCDDANRVDDDGCSNDCISAACGDGITNGGERCDDANGATDDGCIDCVPATCGDGHRWAGVEECDGAALGGATCASEGFDAGTLGCTMNCVLDTTDCVAMPAM